MSADVPPLLRDLVAARAGERCEYCLLPESASLHRHEPDHIVSQQHGGETSDDNLALAWMPCNRFKGPNVGSFDPDTGELVPLFHPRADAWSDHFEVRDGVVHPLTAKARVTVAILRLNDPDRVEERRALVRAGLYP